MTSEDRYKSKLVRKLKFQCRALRQELVETHAIYDTAVPLFCTAVCEFSDKNNLPNPLDKLKEEASPSEAEKSEAYIAETLTPEQKKELPAQFKRIWKHIVVETHPDKNQGSDAGRDLYEQAVEAKKKNKVSELLSVAQDLKIDISHLSYAAIREIEEQIKKNQSDIDSLRASYPWHWYYAPPSSQESIISQFFKASERRL
jgi:hypothetical protein